MNRTPNVLAAATPLKDTSPAYPHVQPLKASLFFESAKGLGEWRLFMSTTAIKDMRNYLRDKKVFKIILKKLRQLSKGFFSDDNHKRLQGPSNGIPIFEAKVTNDLRIIYQIDMMADFERNVETQGIRIYGIFTHAQMDNRMWASLSAQLSAKGSEYRKRIQFRLGPRTSGDKVFLPQSWPDASSAENDASMVSEVNEADRELLHQWLVLEKYSALSMALVNWILSDKQSAPLFSVSPHERAIIEHDSSCQVLGRSGTGKTTVMTFKMIGIGRAVQMHAIELEAKPRQVFVTRSHVLVKRVKEFYVNSSEFFSTRIRSSAAVREQVEDGGLVDPDDDEDLHELPKRFSELQCHHFPLFLTFDKLCELVEADLGITLAESKSGNERTGTRRHSRIIHTNAASELNETVDDELGDPDLVGPSKEAVHSRLVSFESFQNNYWPHFPQYLTKHLDPAVVFSEIVGVIKGSEESSRSGGVYLSQEEYLSLSERTRPTFAGHRESIYLLFERYLELNRRYGHFDRADRAHAILRKLKEGYQFSVDYLYVDEVQDNLIVDVLLLRLLCCNPHGLFWAGDTAQTIAAGSSFRFDDLKSSLYNFERELYPFASEKLVQPEFFQLTTNYRSHGGIVNCASLIIELITHFWPYSIDALQKERAIVDGPRPIIFTRRDNETARYDHFFRKESGDFDVFGDRQCILVRNNRAKKQLLKEIGKDVGTIFTLYESKGLEFDDVLLYDFFEDSSCDFSQWRVVLHFMSNSGRLIGSEPGFAGVCAELKCLYVAITRARKNLWVVDRSDKIEPMKTVLLHYGRIEICSLDNAPKLAVASTPEEWAATGKLYFREQRYSQAIDCFDRACRPLERDIARAYYLREEARNVPLSKGKRGRIDAYLEAGSAFLRCAESISTNSKRHYDISAECFREARDYIQAGLAFEKAEEYTDAATCYANAVMFEDAVRIVKARESVDRRTATKVIDMACKNYIQSDRLQDAEDLFTTREEFSNHLKKNFSEIKRASVLERIGMIYEAAEIYFRKSREKQAIDLLLNDSQNPKFLLRAANYLLACLWQQYSFGLTPKQRKTRIKDPFYYVDKLADAALPEETIEEISVFRAINGSDKALPFNAYKMFLKKQNPQAAVFILDHLISSQHAIKSVHDSVQYLEACLSYVDFIHNVLTHPISGTNAWEQKLFGFQCRPDEKFKLMEHQTLAIHSQSSEYRSELQRARDDLVVNHKELLQLIKSLLKARLSSMVKLQVVLAGRIKDEYLGDPCSTQMVQGVCRRQYCRSDHIDMKAADSTWFNIHVRIHLQQILFLQMVDSVVPDLALKGTCTKEWATSLHNTLNPPLLELGSPANVIPSCIPEYNKSMRALVDLFKYTADQMNRRQISTWFLSEITEVSALTLWKDRDRALELLKHTPFYAAGRTTFTGRSEQRDVAISKLVRSLGVLDPEFIEAGFSLIRDVVRFRLMIDVGHVCRIVELVSAASVLLFKDRHQRDFHNTLLPRSWLFSIVHCLDFDLKHDIQLLLWPLVEYSAALAYHLFVNAGNGHLRDARSSYVRFLAVQRIYRAIFLVAYNTSSRMEDFVLSKVAQLRGAGTVNVPPLLKPFILSNSRPALQRVAECSVPRSHLDGMVQLVQEGRTSRALPERAKATRMTFQSRDDLIRKFAPDRKINNSSGQRAQADSENIASTHESAGVVEGDSAEAPLTSRELVAGCIIFCFFRQLYRRKVRATRNIQRRYSAILFRRRELEDQGFRGKRARLWKACVDVDLKRNKVWPTNGHRIEFLGIVPDLLACLDALHLPIQSSKEKARKQLTLKSKYTDYEEVHLRLTKANTNRKSFGQLKRQLRETSDWHAERKLADLRNVVEEIITLFDELKVEGLERDSCLEIRGLNWEWKSTSETTETDA